MRGYFTSLAYPLRPNEAHLFRWADHASVMLNPDGPPAQNTPSSANGHELFEIEQDTLWDVVAKRLREYDEADDDDSIGRTWSLLPRRPPRGLLSPTVLTMLCWPMRRRRRLAASSIMSGLARILIRINRPPCGGSCSIPSFLLWGLSVPNQRANGSTTGTEMEPQTSPRCKRVKTDMGVSPTATMVQPPL